MDVGGLSVELVEAFSCRVCKPTPPTERCVHLRTLRTCNDSVDVKKEKVGDFIRYV